MDLERPKNKEKFYSSYLEILGLIQDLEVLRIGINKALDYDSFIKLTQIIDTAKAKNDLSNQEAVTILSNYSDYKDTLRQLYKEANIEIGYIG